LTSMRARKLVSRLVVITMTLALLLATTNIAIVCLPLLPPPPPSFLAYIQAIHDCRASGGVPLYTTYTCIGYKLACFVPRSSLPPFYQRWLPRYAYGVVVDIPIPPPGNPIYLIPPPFQI